LTGTTARRAEQQHTGRAGQQRGEHGGGRGGQRGGGRGWQHGGRKAVAAAGARGRDDGGAGKMENERVLPGRAWLNRFISNGYSTGRRR
jgi:hypothetical protein